MEPRGDVDAFVAGADRLARSVLTEADPYEHGIKFMGFCMNNFEVGELAVGLYLTWGAITDGVNGPNHDQFEEWAYDAMKRAASEWLALPTSDEAERQAYVDRWVYDECGYTRPASD